MHRLLLHWRVPAHTPRQYPHPGARSSICRSTNSAIPTAPPPAELDRESDFASRIPTQSLTRIQIENLALLGKVWGFAKYHHARDTGGGLDWDYELFRVIPSILLAPDAEAGRMTLFQWLEEVGSPEPCDLCAVQPPSRTSCRRSIGSMIGISRMRS